MKIETVLMYGVEHCYIDNGRSTYEIFNSLEKAKEFVKNNQNWTENNKPLFIFKAMFNKELIYRQGKEWNYDDFSDTIISDYEIIEMIDEKLNHSIIYEY